MGQEVIAELGAHIKGLQPGVFKVAKAALEHADQSSVKVNADESLLPTEDVDGIITKIGSIALSAETNLDGEMSTTHDQRPLNPSSQATETLKGYKYVKLTETWAQPISDQLAVLFENLLPVAPHRSTQKASSPDLVIGADESIKISDTPLKIRHNLDKFMLNLVLSGEEFSIAAVIESFGPDVTADQANLVRYAMTRLRLIGGEIIVASGNTRSKTFRLNETARIADFRPQNLGPRLRPSVFNFSETRIRGVKTKTDASRQNRTSTKHSENANSAYTERSNIIDHVIKRYQNSKIVDREISQYRTEDTPIRYDSDSLTQYIQNIIKYPLLTAEDEQNLFGLLNRGVEVYAESDGLNFSPDQEQALLNMTIAYNKIYYSNLRLVISAAKKAFKNNSSSYDFLDYIQEGNLALDVTIKRFDISKGNKFSTYAMWWLKQKFQRTNASKSRTIHISNNAHIEWIETLRVEDELLVTLERAPTLQEVGQAMGRKPSEVARILRAGSQNIISLNEKLDDGGSDELSDVIVSPSGIEDFQEALINTDIIATILKKSNLTQSEEIYLSLRYHVFNERLVGTKILTNKGKQDYGQLFKSIKSDTTLSFKEMQKLLGINERSLRSTDTVVLRKLKESILE